MPRKRVLLIVIDALSSWVVKPAMGDGRLPTLAALAGHGLVRDCLSVFPSITPAATAAIVTGSYPAQSGIAGAYWYDTERDDVAYFGDDLWVVLQEGMSNFFDDFLVRLNGERLQVPTLFEISEDAGRSAACLNYLWFRGNQKHEAKVPLLLRLVPGVGRSKPISGPKTLSLGDFVSNVDSKVHRRLPNKGGLLRRFGFDDNNTADQLETLLTADNPPDVCVAYFPENDFQSHKLGPQQALSTVQNVDDRLRDIFDACGGLEALLERFAIIVTGDHSQCELLREDRKAIRLDETLAQFSLADAGMTWSDDDELMACPNMRAAQIYVRRHTASLHDAIIDALLAEPRIDQIFWLDTQDDSRPDRVHVTTADRGRLWFQREEVGSTNAATDRYGNGWTFEGQLACVGATVTANGQLEFDDYPNAFERIEGAFFDRSGSIWITARPGYEFCLPACAAHEGGSHGALHKLDSVSPLIVAGVPEEVQVREHPRSIDIMPLCLQMLGIAPRTPFKRAAQSQVAPLTDLGEAQRER
jgi:predicted AlkP superfamily pyrophosphatase or phosphodiesterase